MPQARAISLLRPAMLIAVASAMIALPLRAQAPGGDAMAFPRQVLTWYLAGNAEPVWERAAPHFREMWGNVGALREGTADILSSMGAETGMISEQTFPHPEGEGWHVYVRGARHAKVPEIFWIVIFSPADRQVGVIMPQPRQTLRTLFPAARLP